MNDDLLAAFDRGEQRALARAITRCESGEGEPLIRALFDRAGRAMTIGLTGPPGSAAMASSVMLRFTETGAV